MLVLIKGAGDLASGIAVRLFRSGFQVVMTDIAMPTTVRCTVAFSKAVSEGTAMVEDVPGALAKTPEEALAFAKEGKVAVLVDPECKALQALRPDVLIDAILAKRNTGTAKEDAPIVIGVGPGFTAPVDCHCAVETQRGHHLGRVFYEGSPAPNSGIPGLVGGYGIERLVRSSADGVFEPKAKIGDIVKAGQVVAMVGESPVCAQIDGVLRGLLPAGTPVTEGMKSGDVDPRCKVEHCYTVSDKARAIGGGVLEAILHQRALAEKQI
jgi:xanthine dehydrogenase accessory factor